MMSQINMFTSDGFDGSGNQTVSETSVIATKDEHFD